MKAAFWREALKSADLTLVFMIGSLVVTFFIARSLAKPIRRLNDQMDSIAQDNFDQEVEGTERKDEIGAMSRVVAVFRKNALDRRRLESESEEEHRAAANVRTRPKS
ncbi:HAMP domain-containing protein [Breoghania sp.]|uniref:HAMP domain-containing protein n=1 Tax=Breoghania sp. TaxID=2065378 RepID=UPI00262DBCE3|nr:HAMP domain-containing protein [Breoghania sp.]MDJ0929713.1 HAMP domain-containing protein [Breoghania sp.]